MKNCTAFLYLTLFLTFSLVLSSNIVSALDCAVPATNSSGIVQGISGSVGFTLQGIDSSVVEGAIDNWSSTCSGNSLPDMAIGGDAEFGVTIEMVSSIDSGNACGLAELGTDPGSAADGFVTRITGGTIYMTENSNIGPCDLEETLTHEIGHMLGLAHAPIQCAQDGFFEIMLYGPQVVRSVQPEECEEAEESNPPEEDEPVDPCNDDSSTSSIWVTSRNGGYPEKVVDPCGGGPGGGGGIGIAVKPCPTSPIVINLNRGGFRFTDVENGVEFDIAGNGIPVQMSWTDPSEGDSFLGLDRNGNGTIDDGQELFGNFTEQPVSENPNGYLALAVFDAPGNGGNDDGIISREDSVFYDLLLWVDSNQNGYSESYELISLSQAGVGEFDLAYVVSGRRDKHGNLIPYKSTARLDGGGTIQTCDVFFLSYVEE